jgi:hypothetical protein
MIIVSYFFLIFYLLGQKMLSYSSSQNVFKICLFKNLKQIFWENLVSFPTLGRQHGIVCN